MGILNRQNMTLPYPMIGNGKIRGCSIVTLNGRNPAISTSTEAIWHPGGAYVQLTAAVAFEAISSSANDAAGGTGARTISVDLVDGSGVMTTVTVTMNGTSAVAITGTFVACNGIRVLTSGSGLTAAGNIDIRTVSGSAVKRRLPTGDQDKNFFYTIPNNYVGILSTIRMSISGAVDTVEFNLITTDSAANMTGDIVAVRGIDFTALNPGVLEMPFPYGYPISENSLFVLKAVTTSGAGVAIATAQLLLINLSDNDLGFSI